MTNPIGWCDRTVNPIVGCTKVSEACDNCYAESMAFRLAAMGQKKYRAVISHDGKWNGRTAFEPEALKKLPKKGKRIFVTSMGDLFHESVAFEDIDKVLRAMILAKQHRFILLTKRTRRMRDYFRDLADNTNGGPQRLLKMSGYQSIHGAILGLRRGNPISNIIGMGTVENQRRADERIPDLLETPLQTRGISIEPMLGEIDIERYLTLSPSAAFEAGKVTSAMPAWTRIGAYALDWVICGGESGPRARPTHPGWVRSLRDQCQAARVPFFFKGWGAFAPDTTLGYGDGYQFDDGQRMMKIDRSYPASHLLDGREWSEVPE